MSRDHGGPVVFAVSSLRTAGRASSDKVFTARVLYSLPFKGKK